MLSVIGAVVVAFAATTWWALESGGVAVIQTQSASGTLRSTHVWYTEPNDELWLEAGTPENAWFQDVQENPAVTFEADRLSGRYVARPVEGPSGHTRIRDLIREKYGFRDRWVGLIVDTSRSVAVQLSRAQE